MTKLIVSYDDTDNDRDALALSRVFSAAGADVALAYVRHSRADDALDARAASQLLARGAQSLGQADIPQHVAVNASTSNGLRDLAEREHADLVVFGSEYRISRGSVKPGTSAQRLLNGGPFAVALAPAGLRERTDHSIQHIGVLADAGDSAADETAQSLAGALGATVVVPGSGPVDLLVVGSRGEGTEGRVLLSATAEYAIETASSAVLVVPRGRPVRFTAPVTTAPAPADTPELTTA